MIDILMRALRLVYRDRYILIVTGLCLLFVASLMEPEPPAWVVSADFGLGYFVHLRIHSEDYRNV